MNSRRTPRTLAAAALAALALAAGSPPPNAPPLRITISAEPESLDPALARSVSAVFVCRQLFEGLLELSPDDLKPGPAAAASFSAEDDGLTLRFALADRRWSDGKPIVATDFVRAWRRVLDPKTAAPYAYLLFGIRGAKALYEGKGDASSIGVEAPDARTLIVRLERPDPSFPALLSFPTFFPVPPAADAGTGWTLPGRIVTNGPYRLAAREPQRSLDLEADPARPGGAPSVARVRILVVEDLNTAALMFKKGESDWARDLPASQIGALKSVPGFRSDPYLGTYFYRLNVRRKPLDDARVRRALALAVDRNALVRALLPGGEAPAASFVPPGMPLYAPPAGLGFDPEAARKILAEAGFPGGKGFRRIEILFNTSENHRRIAEVVRGMWKKHLGIECALSPLEARAALERTQRGDYDIARSSWIADLPDPMNFLEIFETSSGNNRTGWSDAEYDRLLAGARDEPDAARRALALSKAEAVLLERGPIIPVHVYANQALVSPRLRGYATNPLNLQALGRFRFDPAP
ncbi:MAG: peptide ABC transporter substrate-binding protein [Planctomycetota bacterium]